MWCHVIIEPFGVGVMSYQAKSSFPRNGKLISTFLHCRTLNYSSLSSTPSPSQFPSIGILPWIALVIDVLNLFSEDESKLLFRVFVCVTIGKQGLSAGTQTPCFPPLCMYLLFFVFFLPTMCQFSYVIFFFSDVYENVYCVVYLVFFCLVPHYSHCHRYFKSCCFNWKKNIWSKINTIICTDVSLISNGRNDHCDPVKEGQCYFRAAGVTLSLWYSYSWSVGSKRREVLLDAWVIHEATEFCFNHRGTSPAVLNYLSFLSHKQVEPELTVPPCTGLTTLWRSHTHC